MAPAAYEGVGKPDIAKKESKGKLFVKDGK